MHEREVLSSRGSSVFSQSCTFRTRFCFLIWKIKRGGTRPHQPSIGYIGRRGWHATFEICASMFVGYTAVNATRRGERSREKRGTMKRALMLDGARSPRSPVRSWTTNSELRALSLRSGCAASPMRDVAYASPCGARRDAYAGPILTCTCDVCACCAAWCRQAAESFHVGDGAPQCEVRQAATAETSTPDFCTPNK